MNNSHASGPSGAAHPFSIRFCDGALVLFALWTLGCHLVVLFRGNFYHLLTMSALVVGGLLLHRWRFPQPWRLAGADSFDRLPEASRPAAPPKGPSPLSWAVAVVAGGVAMALLSAGRWVLLWWWMVSVLALAAVFLVLRERAHPRPPTASRRHEQILWVLAIACALIALCAHRPDRDDSFYVNLAVAAIDHPEDTLLSDDTLMGIPGLPLHLVAYRVHSVELFYAVISYVTGIPAIYAFHWLSAAIGGLLMPLCFARLFRWLTPRRWLWATIAMVFVLVAVGETHRWYGNFGLVRMWQGKAYFLFLLGPLIYAHALRFAARPKLTTWLLLAAAQISSVGCTSTALWAAPVAALIALSSVLRPFVWRDLLLFFAGALSSTYLLIIGSVLKGTVQKILQNKLQDLPVGTRLPEALTIMLGDSHLLFFCMVAIVSAWALCPPGIGRRFAIVAPLAVLLVLLNPYLAEWIILHLTGPAYWRGLWAMPLPLLMALVLIAPLAWGVRRGMIATLAGGVAFATLVPAFGGLVKKNRVELRRPGLKVPKERYYIASELNRALPKDSVVVAPHKLSAWITTFHHHIYPVMVRRAYLRSQKEKLGLEEVIHRESMANFVDGEVVKGDEADLFRSGLARYSVQAVCMRTDVATAEQARQILREAGFLEDLKYHTYEVWLQPDLAALPLIDPNNPPSDDEESLSLPSLRDTINVPPFYTLDLEDGKLPERRKKS